MIKIRLFLFLAISMVLSSCNNDDGDGLQEGLLRINRTKYSLYESGASFSISGGNYLYDNAGNPTHQYFTISFGNQPGSPLSLFENDHLTDSVYLRFVVPIDDAPGMNTTVGPEFPISDREVVADIYSLGGSSVYAAPGQKILVNITPSQTIINFSHVTFGQDVISGKLKFDIN